MNAPRSEFDCDDVRPLLPLVADGSLDQGADPALFEHLARCSDCQDALAHHDLMTVALERSAESAPGRSSGRRIIFRLPLPWAAAAALLLGIGGWFAAQATWQTPVMDSPLVEVEKHIDALGRTLYLVKDKDGRMQLVDPAAIDGGGPVPERSDAQQVDLKRRSGR